MLYKSIYYIVIIIVFLIGCQDDELVAPIYNDYTADFDSVWYNYDQKYPLFEYKSINWHYYYQNYRDKFVNITKEKRNQLLVEILSIFKDLHIIITPLSGEPIISYKKLDIENNFNEAFINNYLDSIRFKKVNDYWGWSIVNNVGYFQIKSLTSSNIDTLIFDSIMDSLRTSDGIIFDIREEYGGNLNVCKSLWDNFSLLSKTVGYLQYRDGPNHNDYAPLIPVIANNKKGIFDKPVVVLIGERCGSAGEILANSLSYFDNVILVGDTTLGAVVAPSTFTLSDGTKYTVPIVAYLDIYYKPLEWRGVRPDIYIDPHSISNRSDRDLAIEKAFEIIQTSKHITSASTRPLHSAWALKNVIGQSF